MSDETRRERRRSRRWGPVYCIYPPSTGTLLSPVWEEEEFTEMCSPPFSQRPRPPSSPSTYSTRTPNQRYQPSHLSGIPTTGRQTSTSRIPILDPSFRTPNTGRRTAISTQPIPTYFLRPPTSKLPTPSTNVCPTRATPRTIPRNTGAIPKSTGAIPKSTGAIRRTTSTTPKEGRRRSTSKATSSTRTPRTGLPPNSKGSPRSSTNTRRSGRGRQPQHSPPPRRTFRTPPTPTLYTSRSPVDFDQSRELLMNAMKEREVAFQPVQAHWTPKNLAAYRPLRAIAIRVSPEEAKEVVAGRLDHMATTEEAVRDLEGTVSVTVVDEPGSPPSKLVVPAAVFNDNHDAIVAVLSSGSQKAVAGTKPQCQVLLSIPQRRNQADVYKETLDRAEEEYELFDQWHEEEYEEETDPLENCQGDITDSEADRNIQERFLRYLYGGDGHPQRRQSIEGEGDCPDILPVEELEELLVLQEFELLEQQMREDECE